MSQSGKERMRDLGTLSASNGIIPTSGGPYYCHIRTIPNPRPRNAGEFQWWSTGVPKADTSQTTKVTASPAWYVIGIVTFAPFFLFCAAMFVDGLKRFLGYGRVFDDLLGLTLSTGLMAVVLGALIFLLLREAMLGRRPVIFMSPSGFQDIRRSHVTIPWTEITGISSWSGKHAHLRLTLSKEMADQLLGKGRLRRFFNAVGAGSARPIWTTPAGTLDIDVLTLEQIATEYAAVHGQAKPK